jgi:hypothetical protein
MVTLQKGFGATVSSLWQTVQQTMTISHAVGAGVHAFVRQGGSTSK